jgi:hypothetical protein
MVRINPQSCFYLRRRLFMLVLICQNKPEH